MTDGQDADFLLSKETFDLLLLDLNLPGLDGLDVLKRLRKRDDQLPVLILTARSEIAERVRGLDLGADDYIVKPFEMAELEARVRALLRRGKFRRTLRIDLGELTFDQVARRAYRGDTEIPLPRRELALLECLLERPGQVVSKETITDQLYGLDAEVDSSVVELYVHRLRKRLAGTGVQIRTVRGLGYLLET